MELVKDSLSDSFFAKKSFGELIDMMNSHVEDCEDTTCVCDEIENFYDLLKLRMLHNHQLNPLLGEEYIKFNKIIDDHGLVGTISNFSETTQSSEKTVENTYNAHKKDNDEFVDPE